MKMVDKFQPERKLNSKYVFQFSVLSDPENPTIYYRTRVFSRDHLNSTEYKSNLAQNEVQADKSSNKLWFLRKIFRPRGHGYFNEIYEVDSSGLLPLHIIPHSDSPDGQHRQDAGLLAPLPVNCSVSTDSGLSNGSSQL